MAYTLQAVRAREILNSRGNPTVEVDVRLSNGSTGRAAVPSGASTGMHEAIELPDGDAKRYSGKDVRMAVGNVNGEIAAALAGMNAEDQAGIDEALVALDGTSNKSRLGANATLAVSLAVARAIATNQPLFQYLGGPHACRMPVPIFNILNGGEHTLWQGTDFQEFMIALVGAENYAEALRWGAEIYHSLRDHLKNSGHSTAVDDEGGFVPILTRNSDAVDLILTAIEKAGYRPGEDMMIAKDPASSGFYEDGQYHCAARTDVCRRKN